jgi:hypothetical protein
MVKLEWRVVIKAGPRRVEETAWAKHWHDAVDVVVARQNIDRYAIDSISVEEVVRDV